MRATRLLIQHMQTGVDLMEVDNPIYSQKMWKVTKETETEFKVTRTSWLFCKVKMTIAKNHSAIIEIWHDNGTHEDRGFSGVGIRPPKTTCHNWCSGNLNRL